MANRSFNQFAFSLEKAKVFLYMQVSFGASGAPTLNASNSKGIASISRVSAGKYNIILQDAYVRLMMAKHVFINATAPASPSMYVTSSSVSSVSSPQLQVVFNAAGVSTDPGNGEVVLIEIELSNSTAP